MCLLERREASVSPLKMTLAARLSPPQSKFPQEIFVSLRIQVVVMQQVTSIVIRNECCFWFLKSKFLNNSITYRKILLYSRSSQKHILEGQPIFFCYIDQLKSCRRVQIFFVVEWRQELYLIQLLGILTKVLYICCSCLLYINIRVYTCYMYELLHGINLVRTNVN